jgi:hypothetical protein
MNKNKPYADKYRKVHGISTIQLSNQTKDRLAKLGRFGESYEDIKEPEVQA